MGEELTDTRRIGIRYGFTGTQEGWTAKQEEAIEYLFSNRLPHPYEVHHGDCIGSDAQFHTLIRRNFPNTRIAVHPPLQIIKRAFCEGDILYKSKPYLERNREIAGMDWLIATPKTEEEELRSGTWATVRYARQAKTRITIIHPSGLIAMEDEYPLRGVVLSVEREEEG